MCKKKLSLSISYSSHNFSLKVNPYNRKSIKAMRKSSTSLSNKFSKNKLNLVSNLLHLFPKSLIKRATLLNSLNIKINIIKILKLPMSLNSQLTISQKLDIKINMINMRHNTLSMLNMKKSLKRKLTTMMITMRNMRKIDKDLMIMEVSMGMKVSLSMNMVVSILMRLLHRLQEIQELHSNL